MFRPSRNRGVRLSGPFSNDPRHEPQKSLIRGSAEGPSFFMMGSM